MAVPLGPLPDWGQRDTKIALIREVIIIRAGLPIPMLPSRIRNLVTISSVPELVEMG